MGSIDLDPATNKSAQRTVQAKKYFTAENSGLDKKWKGTVWLNPPYGGEAKQFTNKLVAEYAAGNVTEAIVLLPIHSFGTKWIAPLLDASTCYCFTQHRIAFNAVAANTHTAAYSSILGRT